MRPRRLPSFPIVAVSGLSGAGREPGAVRRACEQGRDGLSNAPAAFGVATLAGAVPTEILGAAGDLGDRDSRVARIATLALEGVLPDARRAVERWGAERVAIVIGTSTGGIAASEEAVRQAAATGVLPAGYDFDRQHAFHALGDLVAERTGARGPAYAVSAACSSSSKAFAAAQRLLAGGYADAVVVGGADSLCAMTLRGFSGLRLLSAGRSRPFDASRDGINIGEGAAFALVARQADAPVAHLLGVGETSDAHHMTAPHPEGAGAARAMRAALEIAGVEPAAVGWVHAHGTGTPQNDRVESRAIVEVLGASAPVSSTKGVTGHLLGAAGALSVAIGLDALSSGRMPASVGCATPDADVVVPIVREAAPLPRAIVLCNTFAFGGCNASVLLGREPSAPAPPAQARDVAVTHVAFWTPGAPSLAAAMAGETTGPARPEASLLDARARGRASLLTRMVADVIGQIGRDPEVDLSTVPVVLGSAYGEMETTMALLGAIAASEAPLSPIKFQASVHNTALGILSIRLDNAAFSSAIAAGPRTAAMAILEAFAWLDAHGGEALVVLADEAPPAGLWRTRAFPSMAMALRLTAEPTDTALGRLGHPSLTDVATPEGRLLHHGENPSGGAVGLLEALAAGRSGPVPLERGAGRRWSIELTAPRRRAR